LTPFVTPRPSLEQADLEKECVVCAIAVGVEPVVLEDLCVRLVRGREIGGRGAGIDNVVEDADVVGLDGSEHAVDRR
jgi:hypothetical protein